MTRDLFNNPFGRFFSFTRLPLLLGWLTSSQRRNKTTLNLLSLLKTATMTLKNPGLLDNSIY
jgi:hypothetical protein